MEWQIDNRPAFRGLGGDKYNEIFAGVKTPCYILDEAALRKNGEILASVTRDTGCKVLLAQKAFSNYDLYPVLSEYLSGTEASGLYEARLGAEEMPHKEVHVFSAAYRTDEFEELLKYADHIVFNSPNQLKKYGFRAKECGKSIGLRINPECSTQEGHKIYDPCAPGSRLGTTRAMWDKLMTEELVELLDGLHFHTLCEQNADALAATMEAVEEKFGDILPRMKWLNMGGGHHITRDDYDIESLKMTINYAKSKWNLEIYVEPGEAVALNAGYLASRVLDITQNGDTRIAILDVSAACHMPDVIEMPYTPPLYGAKAVESVTELKNVTERTTVEKADGIEFSCEDDKGNGKQEIYRLAGPTCLAGDVIGDYSFKRELQVGDMLLFGDMAIYSTCKNNTFNGMPLPSILKRCEDGTLEVLGEFGYNDFKMRLGRTKQEE